MKIFINIGTATPGCPLSLKWLLKMEMENNLSCLKCETGYLICSDMLCMLLILLISTNNAIKIQNGRNKSVKILESKM